VVPLLIDNRRTNGCSIAQMTKQIDWGFIVKTTYELFSLSEAKKRELPGAEEWWSEGDGYEYGEGLWRCEDGKPVEYLAQDGGEPEDSSFARDWSWVPGALKRAYDLGWMRAMAQSNVPHDGGGGDGKEID
jgi:hypothetical protein